MNVDALRGRRGYLAGRDVEASGTTRFGKRIDREGAFGEDPVSRGHLGFLKAADRSFPILRAPGPQLRKVHEFYPVGVLSDEVAVASLDCGHLAFDLTEYAEHALCEFCPWSAS